MTHLTMRLLGEPALVTESGRVVRPKTVKETALLVRLARRVGESVTRAELAGLLWADSPENQARASLRQSLFTLRKALDEAGNSLIASRDRCWLDPERVTTDIADLERRLKSNNVHDLEAVPGLYGGPLASNLGSASSGFDDWLDGERRRLHDRTLEGLARLLEWLEASGALEGALAVADRTLELDAVNETAHRALMRVYQRLGRRIDALRQYDRCVLALRRELGVCPSAATLAMKDMLLADPQDMPAAFPPAARHDRLAAAPVASPLSSKSERHAVDRLRAAAHEAAARSAFREAAAMLERAIELSELDDERDALADRVDMHAELARLQVPLGEVERIHGNLRAGIFAARRLGDRDRLARMNQQCINASWLSAHYGNAIAAAGESHRLAQQCRDGALEAATNFYLGQAFLFSGSIRQASMQLRRNADISDAELHGASARWGLPGEASLLSKAWLVWSLSEMGEFEAAEPISDAVIAAAEAHGHPFTLVDVIRATGIFRLHRGDLAEGQALVERGLDVARRYGLELWYPSLLACRGWAKALRGSGDSAVKDCREALEQSDATGIVAGRSLRQAWLAGALLAVGETAEAARVALDGLCTAVAAGERGTEARLHQLIGEIALVEKPRCAALAEASFRRALGLAVQLHMRPLQAKCEQSLAKC